MPKSPLSNSVASTLTEPAPDYGHGTIVPKGAQEDSDRIWLEVDSEHEFFRLLRSDMKSAGLSTIGLFKRLKGSEVFPNHSFARLFSIVRGWVVPSLLEVVMISVALNTSEEADLEWAKGFCSCGNRKDKANPACRSCLAVSWIGDSIVVDGVRHIEVGGVHCGQPWSDLVPSLNLEFVRSAAAGGYEYRLCESPFVAADV